MAKSWRTHALLVLAVGVVLWGAPRSALAGDRNTQHTTDHCLRAMQEAAPATATLRIDHARVAYDFNRGRDDLYAIVRRHGSADASARMSGRRVHGLTHSSLGYHLQASFDLQGLPDGTWCLWPRATVADLGYTDTTVYVARDYAAGTCAFEAVLAHEEEHVAINTAVVDDHAPRLRNVLATLTRQGFPLVGSNPDVLRGRAQAMLDHGFRNALTPLLTDRSHRNAAIDSEHSYRALNAQCARW